jgi:hypothetical protein
MMINLLRNAPQGRERLASIFLVSIEATCVLLPEGSATSSMFEAELRALERVEATRLAPQPDWLD